jgi:hypothetical protein
VVFAGQDGNIGATLVFRDAAGGDYRLAEGSPGMNAGHPELAPRYDILGVERHLETPDVGVYEDP